MTAGQKPFIVRAGDFFFKYRNALFPAAFAVVMIASRPAHFMNDSRLDFFVTLAGALLVVFGQGFRLAVIGYAYIKRGGKDGRVFAEKLVVRGFYSHTRNPMYVGNLAITIGLAVMYGSAWAYFFAIPFYVFAYLAITAAEENYLRRQFGAEYEAYVKRVNRFVPDFRGIGESLKDYRYDWKRALRKDYGNVFQALIGIIVIASWKQSLLKGADVIPAALAAALLAVAFYLAVRFLKKSGRLASPNG